MTDQQSVDDLARRAGDVTIVINNAGADLRGPLLGNDLAEVASLFDVNVFGPLRVAQAFAPVLRAHGGGALVDVHSVLSWAAGAGA